ncbi:MAG: hypothetical protein WC793_01035 [Candidatus Paceibacterota bacterium]
MHPDNIIATTFIMSDTLILASSSGTPDIVIFKLPPPVNKIQHFIELVNK